MRTWFGIAIALIAAGIVIALFMTLGDQQAPASPTQPGTPPESVSVEQNRTPVQYEQPVQLTTQFFSPAEITIEEGDTLTLIINSIDQDHSVYITSTGETVAAPQGVPTRITLGPGAPGELTVTCTDRCEGGVTFTLSVR